MKLRNKKTGEIVTSKELLTDEFLIDLFSKDFNYFVSKLNKMVDEYEAYEEDKRYWYIDADGEIMSKELAWFNQQQDDIGNRFETREEAEKAVEKLKAVKRLKEENIDYKLSREYDDFTETMHANVSFSFNSYPLVGKDLDLLFGDEE